MNRNDKYYAENYEVRPQYLFKLIHLVIVTLDSLDTHDRLNKSWYRLVSSYILAYPESKSFFVSNSFVVDTIDDTRINMKSFDDAVQDDVIDSIIATESID